MTRRRLIAGASVLVFLIAATVPRLLPAQVPQTRLLYDEGGVFGSPKTAIIRLTDPTGEVPPDTAATQAADQVHFLYRPSGDWTFSDDAPETLRKIVLQQNGTRVRSENVTLQRKGDKATAARVTYPRSKIDWLKPLAFAHEVDTSATMSLPDVYAADYPALRRPYDRGRQLIDTGKPLRALDTLSVFYGEVTPAFEFVADAKAALDTAAAVAVQQKAGTFQALRNEVVSSPSAETLDRLEAFQAQLDTLQTALGSYLKKRPEAGNFVKKRLDNLDQSAGTLYENAYETYRQKTVRVFFQKPYTRAKPALFIDVLARLLLHPHPALAASNVGLDSLSAELLTGPRYDDARQTLRQERWWQDFQDVMTVVDNNLRRHDRIFSEKVFRSLKLQRTSAKQPYYEMLAALNAAAAGDQKTFQEQWDRALATCTDLNLLNALQQWLVARRTPPSQVPAAVPTLMEKAEQLKTQQRPDEALQQLRRASRQSDYAPLRYALGRLQYAQGDTTLARRNFKQARSVAPHYTAPKVGLLSLHLDQGNAKEALHQADSTLQTEPYWLVYFQKARALGTLGQIDEGVNVLRQRCEQLNDQSYALYVLLAELYVQENAWKGAAWAVKKAETFDPKRPAFISRLRTVREKVRKSENVSLEKTTSDPAAGSSL